MPDVHSSREPEKHPRKRSSLEYSSGSETILLVEDEELLRQVIAQMLGDLGYRVLSTASGTEALAIGQTFASEIHLLITDMLMPELDGARLAESLCRSRPGLKVLFVTGDNSEPFPAVPGISRLDKPFTLRMLASTVRELLEA